MIMMYEPVGPVKSYGEVLQWSIQFRCVMFNKTSVQIRCTFKSGQADSFTNRFLGYISMGQSTDELDLPDSHNQFCFEFTILKFYYD